MRRAIHEHSVRRPARKSFERKRPRPREEIEHARIIDACAQHTEERLARAVSRRTRAIPCRGFQPYAARTARNDPHRIPPAILL